MERRATKKPPLPMPWRHPKFSANMLILGAFHFLRLR